MTMLLSAQRRHDPAWPVITADSRIGQLAVPVREMPASTPVPVVDAMFRRDPQLGALAVISTDGPRLLTRGSLQTLLIGPMGYGRAVNERRTLQGLVEVALVLPADTTLGLAAQLLLDRPLERRYDDVLVMGPAGLGLVTVSSVFEGLALHFAYQAVHDPLTGLPNRLLLAESVRRLPTAAAGSTMSPALLYVDLDGFKTVNDDFGHDVGDAVLRQYAQRLREAVRPGDVVARLGGDEFALLLVEAISDEQASAVADRLVLLAAAPFLVADLVITIGASVGIARAAGDVERRVDPVEALLRSADTAMYRAKNRGRGRVERSLLPHGDDGAPARRRSDRDLDIRLRAALERGSLSLAFQPKYELRTGRLLEQEALARWDDGTGPVSPAVFIPAAERSGLIHELGRWALQEACEQAGRWEGGEAAPVVAVNVSPQQLVDGTFVACVAEVLAQTGLPASRLCLEITETSAIEDLAATREQLFQLRALGVLIALDDFGTGHASLTLLRSLPLSWVKIDRSFVEEVANDPAGAVLVRLVIEAAHSLGVLVCAEGVERQDQLTQLASMGCDAVQGFLLGVPSRSPQRGPSAELAPAAGAVTEPRTLLAGPGQLVLLCDADGLVTYVSAESVRMLGYQPAEMTGTTAGNYLAHEADDRSWEPLVRLVDLPEGLHLRALQHRDGSVVWAEATVRRIGGTGSTPAAVLVTATDVTARVVAEVALADRDDLLGAAFDDAPIGMALTAPNGRHLKVNAALCRILDRSEAELLALRWQDVTHPDDLEADRTELRAALAGTQDGYRLDKSYRRPDGSSVRCRLQVKVIRNADGSVGYLVAHMQPQEGWV